MKKSNIGTIAGKEFYRFFHDKGLILSLIFPAILLYFLYAYIIPGFTSQSAQSQKTATLYVIDMPANLEGSLGALKCTVQPGTDSDRAEFEKKLKGDEDALLLVFPQDFSAQVAAYNAASGSPAPNIELYYKSVSTPASALYSQIVAALDSYESAMSNKFDVNRDVKYDLSSQKEVSGQVFSRLLPMLLLIFLFTGCMSFAPDSIAGEKERGTMATMLVTPIHRYEIVVGKILAFSVIAVLSGGLTFAAVSASLPKLVHLDGEAGIAFTGYAPADYGMLLLVIVTTALLMISLVSLISTFAKTTKEAASMVSPLMVVVMIVGFSTMSGSTLQNVSTALFCVPIYNSVLAMTGIFAYSYSAADIALCAVTNLVYTAVIVLIIVRVFKNERVMFGK